MTTLGDDLKTVIDADWTANPPTKTCYIYHTNLATTPELDNPPEFGRLATPLIASGKVVIIIYEYDDSPARYGEGSDYYTGEGRFAIWGISEANVDSAMVELKKISENNDTGILLFTRSTIINEGEYFVAYPRFTWRRIVDHE